MLHITRESNPDKLELRSILDLGSNQRRLLARSISRLVQVQIGFQSTFSLQKRYCQASYLLVQYQIRMRCAAIWSTSSTRSAAWWLTLATCLSLAVLWNTVWMLLSTSLSSLISPSFFNLFSFFVYSSQNLHRRSHLE